MKRVALLFLILTIAMTFPVAFDLNHRFASGLTDPPFTMWTMAWQARTIESDLSDLFNANIFYPASDSLTYSSLNLAPMLVEFPILRASGNPILAYNFVYLFAWWLNGFAVFLLARSFRFTLAASIASGALAEFSFFSFNQIGHLEILWFGWIPLYFLAAQIFLKRGGLLWSTVCMLFFLLASLASWYLAIYLLLTAVAFAIYSVHYSTLHRTTTLAISILLACLTLLPFLLPYLKIKSGIEKTRAVDQVESYSARPGSYLQVPAINKTWQGFLATEYRTEANFYPGTAIVLLALLGIHRFWRRGPSERFWICLGIISIVLTFGPILRLDSGAAVPLPEYLLRVIPGYSLTRVPSRWALFAAIALAICASAGIEQVARKRGQIAAVLTLLALMEHLSAPLPTSTLPTFETLEPEYRWLAAQPPSVIAELPMSTYSDSAESVVGYMYRSIFHHHSLVNGYADYVPEWYYHLAEVSRTFPSEEFIALLKEHGTNLVVVHTDRFSLPNAVSLTPIAQFDRTLIYQLPIANRHP